MKIAIKLKIFFLIAVVFITGCKTMAVVGVATGAVVGVTTTAVKVTTATVGAVIPDGDDEEDE